MTEVVRHKIKSIFGTTTSTASVFIFLLSCHLAHSHYFRYGRPRRHHELLKFGDQCSIPRQGGELSIVNECDASKGLMCDGKACVCTFPEYFSYDQRSDECRKKLGKSCRYTKEEAELRTLPFHLKCHSTASCTLLGRSLNFEDSYDDRWRNLMVEDVGGFMSGFTMCICKQGFEPTARLDGCQVPRPRIYIPPLNKSHKKKF